MAGENQLRQPPHDLVAESSVLGAMLLNKMAIADVVEVLEEEHFYRPANGHIYSAITTLYATGEPVDPVTVASELTAAGLLDAIGGPSVLFTLQKDVPAVGNAGAYARIVEEKALLRRAIEVSNAIAEMAYAVPDDVAKMIDEAEALMYDVGQRRITGTMVEIKDLLGENLDRLEALYEQGDAVTGMPTGYVDLDKLMAGLQKNAMYVVGARPGMGKTAFLLGLATNIAKAGHPVLLFSLEMSNLELSQRILCSEAKVDSTRIKTGNLNEDDWTRIAHATGVLAETPIFIDDYPQTSIMEIRAKARRLKSQVGDLGLVAVDYIQLMSGRANSESRQQEVSEISRNLKILARELECPVIALAQLNRKLEERAEKRPMLSDLRESGCMPADTRVLRADTGTEVTMGELVLSQEEPLVWSVDDRGKVVPARLTKTWPSGKKEVFALTLASGRTVKASANHPFLTVEGWRRLDQVSAGDFLAVPRTLPEPTKVEEAQVVSDDELLLLGHLIGDGTMLSNYRYATIDPRNAEAVGGAVKRLFDVETDIRMNGRTMQLWFPAGTQLTHGKTHPMTPWSESFGLRGKRSWEKFVPDAVKEQSEKSIAIFLHHLWATDGSITVSRNGRGAIVRTYYATTSRQLADDVQMLLLRIGIGSTISTTTKKRLGGGEYRPCYHVRIQGSENQSAFLSSVGCHGERGDVIPDALQQLATVKPNSAELMDIATSDVYWDKIVSIESLGVQPTFDVSVEGTHNFIANGIVAHNSLEQDADAVFFLYRDEQYNAESQDAGMAEVIVAKHRSGPTGTVKLAFLGRFTRFENMAYRPDPPGGGGPGPDEF